MRFLYGFDYTYLIFIVPCIIITLICQIRVKSAFSKYSNIPNSRNMTGAQAAEYVLRQNGVTGVRIEHVAGSLSDHFDPRSNTIRLQQDHAVQHAQNYLPNKIRGAILPAARVGSSLSWIFILIGFVFYYKVGALFLYIGIILFSASVLFTLATLPVEFDASRRALKTFRDTNLLPPEEYNGARSVLRAAAMTYVASALTAIMQLLRLLFIARRRN